MPDVRAVVAVTANSQENNEAFLRDIFSFSRGTTVYQSPVMEIPDIDRILMVFYPEHSYSFENAPELRWEDGKLAIYPGFETVNGPVPSWLFTIGDGCKIVDKGRVRDFKEQDRPLVTAVASLQVSQVVWSAGAGYTIAENGQTGSGTISCIYVDPGIAEIFRRRNDAIRNLIIGGVLTLIGLYYFYGPRRGWLKWREGLTLPDDHAGWES
jgi:hypothetical protein